MNEKEEEQKEQQQIKFHREYLCVSLIARSPHLRAKILWCTCLQCHLQTSPPINIQSFRTRGWNPNIFVNLEPMQNFRTLGQPLLGKK